MSAIGSHRNFQHLSKISITLAEVLGRVKVVVADDLAEPGPGSFDKGVVFVGAQVVHHLVLVLPQRVGGMRQEVEGVRGVMLLAILQNFVRNNRLVEMRVTPPVGSPHVTSVTIVVRSVTSRVGARETRKRR